MEQSVTRLGVDNSAGHCYEPRPTQTASENVFVNGIAVNRISDYYPTHSCPPDSHDGVASEGSSSVFINGLAAHRIADEISCGDVSASGSPDVFIG